MENDDDDYSTNNANDHRCSVDEDGGDRSDNANGTTEFAESSAASSVGSARVESEGRFEGETEEEVDASLREALLVALKETDEGKANKKSTADGTSSGPSTAPDSTEELRDIQWMGMFRGMWIEKRYDSKEGKWKARVKKDRAVSSSLRPLLGVGGDEDEDEDTAAESSDDGGDSSAEDLVREIARLRRKLRSQKKDQDDVEIGVVPEEPTDDGANAARVGAFRVRGTGDDGEINDDDIRTVDALPRMQNFDAITLVADLVVEHEAVQATLVRRQRQIISIGGLVLLSFVIAAMSVGLPLGLKRPASPTKSKPDYRFVSVASLQDVFNKTLPNSTLEAINLESTPQADAYRWLFASAGDHPDLPESEAKHRLLHRFALATLFYATGEYDSWKKRTGWLDPTEHECLWHGVACAKGADEAFALCEKEFGIPSVSCWFRNHSMIDGIDLSENALTQSLPGEIGLLSTSMIQSMKLETNSLEGTIPSEIKELTSLRTLSLTRNKLGGTIPSAIGNLRNLEALFLSYNQLKGTLPVSLANLGKLKDLDLSQNGLAGTIPARIGLMTSLVTVALSRNALTGLTPTQISELTSLTSLDLSGNDLTPSFADGTGKAMRSLQVLALSGRKEFERSSTIPTQIGEFASLTRLELFSSSFSGSIPSELGQLKNLTHLQLNDNPLTGTIPTELGNLRNLILWNTYDNIIGGSLPSQLAKLTALEQFVVRSCSLSGTIPSEFGNMTKLRVVDLSINIIGGVLPSELGQLTALEEFTAGGKLNRKHSLHTNPTRLPHTLAGDLCSRQPSFGTDANRDYIVD